MNRKRLRVIVLTQQDSFFIPSNIIKASKVCDIIEVVDNHAKSSVKNKIFDMLKWFGFFQCAKMGIIACWRKIQRLIDRLSGFRWLGGTCSIQDAARVIGAEYRVVTNVNSKDYLEHVRELSPDLVISYSAPQIIKPELLSISKYGILNVHGALLPDYRGCLPSFWYLFNNESLGGATVHYMSEGIDDGDICIQKSIDISDCKTMFQLMRKTKLVGGECMIEAIEKVTNGTLVSRPNEVDKGRYFTWPTVEQAKAFRRAGKRLV